MITLVVKINVHPQFLYDFVDATKILARRTLSTERQCRAYTVNKDPNNEDVVILVEMYDNQEAIDFHKTTEHFLEWKETVKDMGQRTSTRYEEF